MRDKMTGWQIVYTFNFMQRVKSRWFKILTLILLAIAIGSMPLVSLLSQDKDLDTSLEEVYVLTQIDNVDTAEFAKAVQEISQEDELYKEVVYTPVQGTYEEIREEIKNADEDYHKVLLNVSYTASGLTAEVLYGDNTSIAEDDANAFSKFLTKHITEVLVNNLSITQEQMAYIDAPINRQVIVTAADGEIIDQEGTVPLSMPLYIFGCFIFSVLAFILSINAESITSSIVMEKSSRVIEYIMVSIKPMAVVVGKVLAMLSITFLEIIVFLIGFVISLQVSPQGMPSVLKEFIKNTNLNQLDAFTIILAVILFILGFLLYSIIAALLGATVSKIEQASEATKVYMVLMFIGIYMSIALIIMQMIGIDVEIYKTVVFLVPFSSAIALPYYLLIGQASIGITLISIGIVLVCLILLTLFVARVYGYILYHNGSTVKLKELFKISKELRKGDA